MLYKLQPKCRFWVKPSLSGYIAHRCGGLMRIVRLTRTLPPRRWRRAMDLQGKVRALLGRSSCNAFR